MQHAVVPTTMTQNDPQDREVTESPRREGSNPAPDSNANGIHIANEHRRNGSRAARRKVSPKVEALREHRRYVVAETFLRVTWLDANGDLKVEHGARPIDISEMGMAVQLPEPALLLSRIRMESEKGELLGHGKVRSCRPMGEKYIVGIQFADKLRWSAPEGPISEPIPLCPPGEEPEPAPGASPQDLLLSEALAESQPATAQAGTQTANKIHPAPMQLVWEPHLYAGGVRDGFFARLPMAVKVGAPMLVVLGLSSLFLGHGRTMSASSAGHGLSSNVGEQGWVTEWASDEGGSRRRRQISLYRPSMHLSDYQMQFNGQIESKAIGWVFRAADTKNYYGMKIESDKNGAVRYTRFAVVHGFESRLEQKALPFKARVDTIYNVKLEATGPHFSVYIQGEPVDLWTDNRIKAGALGFMNEADESGRTNSVRISFHNTSDQ
jgi:hypothetical protein